MTICKLCTEAYKNGKPENFASEPSCAFKNGVFTPDNWQCQTANALRNLHDQYVDKSQALYNDDQWAVLIPISEGRFLILSWYKNRGKTEGIFVLDQSTIRAAAITDVEQVFRDEPNRL